MKVSTAAAIVVVLCGLIVRSEALFSYFYNPDELMHLSISQGGSLIEVLERSREEVHPPLEQVLKWCVLEITDDIDVLRLIYCLVGMLGVFGLASAAYAAGGISAGLACLALAGLMPASVYSSVLIRGYGLFLLTSSLAIGAFIRLLQATPGRVTRRFCSLGVWLMLACATNFSGFLLAGAIFFALLCSLLRQQKFRVIGLILILAVVIAAEGLGFLWWYFSSGTGALEWRSLASSHYFVNCARFAEYPFWVLRLLTIFSPVPATRSIIELSCIAGAVVALLYLYALTVCARRHLEVALFVVSEWVIALIANFSGMYPLVGPRHSIYLLPAILMPLALLIGAHMSKRLLQLAGLVALLAAVMMRGSYFEQANDFPLTKVNYEAARRYIEKELSPSDLILTDRLGLLYVLYENDKLKTFYHRDQTVSVGSVWGRSVYAATPGRMWQFGKADLISLLTLARESEAASNQVAWLVSLGFKDNLVERIRVCAATAMMNMRGMQLPGVSITGLAVKDLEKLADPQGECLLSYKEDFCGAAIYGE